MEVTGWESRCPRPPRIASNMVQAHWDTNSCFPSPQKSSCVLPKSIIPLINIRNRKCLTFPIVWLLWEAELEEEPILFQAVQVLLDIRRVVHGMIRDGVNIQGHFLSRNRLIRS